MDNKIQRFRRRIRIFFGAMTVVAFLGGAAQRSIFAQNVYDTDPSNVCFTSCTFGGLAQEIVAATNYSVDFGAITCNFVGVYNISAYSGTCDGSTEYECSTFPNC